MDESKSMINPILTVEYMTTEDENQYFDRKSVKIKPAQLDEPITAFANAQGGCIVIGIDDKTLAIEGINAAGKNRINEWINAPVTCCKPAPQFQYEFVDVLNAKGEPDRLLLLHIQPSTDRVIRASSDKTYLRIGDKSREIRGDGLLQLEYSKGTRHFEDECTLHAGIKDLDQDLLKDYRKHIGAEDMDDLSVLRARRFLVEQKGKEELTNAAVLLFATNIRGFYPNCRVRFVRYNGVTEEVGINMNIIKDVSMDEPILRLAKKAPGFIATQLRDLTSLDPETGLFKTVHEYPEFAWTEGIINAICHRDYAQTGNYILIKMFDDRLEINSPGKLPNIVTVENIQETRYARNPVISRVMTEMGMVRELNEGVKRIFVEMQDAFLDPPVYTEPGYNVRLLLKNNIKGRQQKYKSTGSPFHAEAWDQLDELDKQIITFTGNRGRASKKELMSYTGKAERTVSRRLNHLLELEIIKRNGKPRDPNLTYSLAK